MNNQQNRGIHLLMLALLVQPLLVRPFLVGMLLVLSFLIKILLLGLFVSYIRINAPIVVVVGKETGLLLSADNTRTKGDCERLHINNPLHALQQN